MIRHRARSPQEAGRRAGPIDRMLTPALFKALCDGTRVRLLACLAKCGRGCTVSEIAACCDVDMSVVSRHLAAMRTAGVLESQRSGRTVTYRVRYGALCGALRGLADALAECAPGGACDCEGGGGGCR